jgi:hypothetical protein
MLIYVKEEQEFLMRNVIVGVMDWFSGLLRHDMMALDLFVTSMDVILVH